MSTFTSSIRFRAALAFVLLSVAINVLLTLTFSITRERAVVSTVDARLLRLAGTLRGLVTSEGIGAVKSDRVKALADVRVVAQTWFVQLRDSEGVVVGQASAFAEPVVFDTLWTLWSEPGVKLDTVRTGRLAGAASHVPEKPASNERVRTALSSIRLEGAAESDPPYRMLVGISLDPADRMTREIERTLLWTAAAATVAAGLAGWIVSSGFARRLRRVGDALNAVTPRDFSRGMRLPASADELGDLAASLNTMLVGLERAFRGQERFISDVSHELKTPLAALLTEAQVLHSGDVTLDDYRAFVASTEDEARRLGKLVESFLMLIRFEHGRRFVADALVPINDVAVDAIRHTQSFAQQRRVTVHFNAYDPGDECNDGLIRGDAELLRVAIDNVLRNAVQVSKSGDVVEVNISCVDGRTMRIDIRDKGPGLAPDYMDRIFNRFEHARVRESGTRGTGLGLAIAKGIIDLHGGKLSATSHAEGGCVFHVELTLAEFKEKAPDNDAAVARVGDSESPRA